MYPKALEAPATGKATSAVGLAPVVPVNTVSAAGDGLLVTLHTAGCNLVPWAATGSCAGRR